MAISISFFFPPSYPPFYPFPLPLHLLSPLFLPLIFFENYLFISVTHLWMAYIFPWCLISFKYISNIFSFSIVDGKTHHELSGLPWYTSILFWYSLGCQISERLYRLKSFHWKGHVLLKSFEECLLRLLEKLTFPLLCHSSPSLIQCLGL